MGILLLFNATVFSLKKVLEIGQKVSELAFGSLSFTKFY